MFVALIHVFVALIPVIVMHIDHGELDGIDTVTKSDYPGLIRAGVAQELLQPVGLQAETDIQNEIRICHPGNVASSRQECMWIATHREQAEYLHPVSTHLANPVSHKVGGCHHLDRRPGGCGSFPSSRGCGLGGFGCLRGLSRLGCRVLDRLVRGDEGGVHDICDLVGGELVADRLFDGLGNQVLYVAARKRVGEAGAHLGLDDSTDLVGADALRHRLGNRGVDESDELGHVDLRRRRQCPEGLVDDRLYVGRGELPLRRLAHDSLDVRTRQTFRLRGDGRRHRLLYLGGAGALCTGDCVLNKLGRVDRWGRLRLVIPACNSKDQSRNRCDHGH